MTDPIDPLDYLDLGRLLSDEEGAIRDTVRTWVGDRVLPGIEGWFEAGEFPLEVAKELGAMGLLGMHLTGYECAGANAVSYGAACLELEAGDSGFRSFVSVQGSLCMFAIWKFGSKGQKQRWLPAMARGEGARGFLVPTDAPGFSANDVHRRLSLRASVTSALVPAEPGLPQDAVLPD